MLIMLAIAAAVALCPPAHKFGGEPIYLSRHDRVMDGFIASVVPLPPRRPRRR